MIAQQLEIFDFQFSIGGKSKSKIENRK